MWTSRFRSACGLALVFGVAACSQFSKKASEARTHLRANQPDQAAQVLEENALKPSDDQLVYLLDYAQALQQGGRYKESTKAFLSAVDIAKIQDYTSLSREAGSVLLSENLVQYKGENYEKLLIHVQLAINFLMQGQMEEALVEVRAMDLMLEKFRNEAKKEYEQNTFSRYLSALIWEADRKWDDALIAYKKVFSQRPQIRFLGSDLTRSAQMGRFPEDLQKFKKDFQVSKSSAWWTDPNKGEIILIYQQGVAPVKRADPQNPRLPRLFPVFSTTQKARVEVGGDLVETEEIYNVTEAAIRTLDEDYGRLVAKRVGGIVAKAVVADQIRQKNEFLGFLAWVGMNLADQADTRQWSTLPSTYQVARVPVRAGTHQVFIRGLSSEGAETGESAGPFPVVVGARKKVFLMWRTY